MEQKIIEILQQFQQRDYSRGGVSIPPEMYETIAKKIIKDIVKPEIISKEHFRKQRDNAIIASDKTDVWHN